MDKKITKPRLIYGNGSMARVYYSYLKRVCNVVGFIVDAQCIPPEIHQFCNLPLYSLEESTHHFNPNDFDVTVSIGYIQMNELRKKKTSQLKELGYTIAGYIHEDFILHDNVTIGEGCVILENVSVHCDSTISDGVFIAGNVNIGHDCKIGEYCWINAGVAMGGGTNIGPQTFFGVNSTLANGITIGEKTFIGGGAFVSHNTEKGSVYLSPSAEKFRFNSDLFVKFSNEFHSK